MAGGWGAVVVRYLGLLASMVLGLGGMTGPVYSQQGGAAKDAATPLLSLTTIGPGSVNLGQPVTYEIVAKNTSGFPLQDVVVRDELPAGAKFLGALPAPDARTDKLTWNVGSLEAGAERRFKVEIQPSREGEIIAGATATCSVAASLRLKVTQPRLALTKTGPETVPVGDPAVFEIKVTNTGSGPASGVVVTDRLPAGLWHEQGDQVETDLGTLAAGESKTVTLKTKAAKVGRLVNEAVAHADGGLRITAQAVLTVTQAELALRKSGPQRCYLNRPVEFSLEASNPGTGPAVNVRLTDTLPAGLEFDSASDNGKYEAAGRTVTWTLGTLEPRQKRGVTVKTLAKEAGDLVNQALVQADRGLESRATATVHVEGIPALMLEVVDLDDPVEVGTETTYEIRVLNQGTAASTGVQIIATVPKEMTTKSASGPTAHRQQGQQVIFEPIPKLAARADALFRVRVVGQEPGDLRFKVQLTCDQLQRPVYEEESTRVYSEKE